MTNRRQFLQIGLASSTIPIAAGANQLAAFDFGQPGSAIPFYKVIVDERFPESVEFGAAMAEKGFDTFSMRDDTAINDFWYGELNPIWDQYPVAVTGFTKFGPMFCLQQLSRTYGARLIYQGDHRYAQHGQVSHHLNGPEKMLEKSRDIFDFSNEKLAGHTVADLVMSCEVGKTALVDMDFSEQANHQSSLTDARPEDNLVSWIVAPARIS